MFNWLHFYNFQSSRSVVKITLNSPKSIGSLCQRLCLKLNFNWRRWQFSFMIKVLLEMWKHETKLTVNSVSKLRCCKVRGNCWKKTCIKRKQGKKDCLHWWPLKHIFNFNLLLHCLTSNNMAKTKYFRRRREAIQHY